MSVPQEIVVVNALSSVYALCTTFVTKCTAAGIPATIEETPKHFPAVVVIPKFSEGERTSAGWGISGVHTIDITCYVSSAGGSFAESVTAVTALAQKVVEQMKGFGISMIEGEKAVEYKSEFLGATKGRSIILHCEGRE